MKALFKLKISPFLVFYANTYDRLNSPADDSFNFGFALGGIRTRAASVIGYVIHLMPAEDIHDYIGSAEDVNAFAKVELDAQGDSGTQLKFPPIHPVSVSVLRSGILRIETNKVRHPQVIAKVIQMTADRQGNPEEIVVVQIEYGSYKGVSAKHGNIIR